MRPRILTKLCFLLLIFSNPLQAADASGDCLKQVFGEFCLGSGMQQLLQRRPGGLPTQRDGERSAVVYPQGRERIYVMAYRGRIYKILRTFEPPGQVKLRELRQSLESKYGAYRDLSRYPAYAKNTAARIGAIRRGEGELKYHWQSADGAWSVELSWTRRLGVSLAYLANALDAQQREAMDREL